MAEDSLPSVAATGASGRASPSPFGLDAVIPASPASSSGGGSGMHRTPSGNFMPRNNSGLFSREPSFDCNICLDMPTDPVVTMCGHLFCWPCLFKWMERQATCPVCKSTTNRESIIPLYGRGKTAKTHSMKNGQTIPDRPAGQRAESASGVGGTAAAQQAAQAGHFIQLADGFGGAGFLSTLFGSQIQFPANDRRDLTPEQMHLATLSRILLFMGSCIIFSLIML